MRVFQKSTEYLPVMTQTLSQTVGLQQSQGWEVEGKKKKEGKERLIIIDKPK